MYVEFKHLQHNRSAARVHSATEHPGRPQEVCPKASFRSGAVTGPAGQFIGRRLTDVTVFRGYSPQHDRSGLRLDFNGEQLMIGAFADERVLTRGAVPPHLAAHWSVALPEDNVDGI
jgi:hypothetical protein